MTPIRVWDWPTRLFHWILTLAIVGLLVTGNVGGGWMEWHMRIGLLVLTLLWFRLLWGLFGGHWSRFTQFVYSPSSVWQYLRGRSPWQHRIGHTPLGALAVFALLGILGIQVGTGLFTDDEIFYAGPLAIMASYETIAWASQYHKGWGKWLLIGLVSLHVLAILFYTVVKRQRLVRAMVTGDRVSEGQAPASSDTPRDWLKAGVLFGVSCALTYGIVNLPQ